MDSIDSNCDAWHANSPDKVGLGSSLLGNKLLDQGLLSFISLTSSLTNVLSISQKFIAVSKRTSFYASKCYHTTQDENVI